MDNIILIGMPGAGKSTIGVILAKRLQMDFLDTDIIIQKKHGRLLQEIIDKEGIDAFLKKEEEEIACLNLKNYVIATGGSAVLSKKAMEHLKKLGKIVYINVALNCLKKRIKNMHQRGIVIEKGQSFEDVYNYRGRLYKIYADFTVDTSNLTLEESADRIYFELYK